jgi:two-component system sensor histidine kinase DesK
MSSRFEHPRVRRARIVVLAFLASNVVWAVGIPLSLTELAPWWAAAAVSALLAVHAVAYLAALRGAVSPWIDAQTRGRLMAGLVLTTVALWPLMAPRAEPGQEPWAWLAAFVIGVAPLLVRWPWAGAIAAGLGGLAALGAVLWHSSVLQSLAFSLGGGAVAAIIGVFVVWMLRLLVAADAGREAESALAVAEERLRFARELHDALGHRLTVIALKAEVATGLTGGSEVTDAGRIRAELEEIRDHASRALQEARRAAHGYGTVDLPEQLRSAQLVLGTAGVEANVRVGSVDLGVARSQLVAAVVREGVTNILLHSDARQVDITLDAVDGGVVLVVTNDRPRPAGVDGGGMGLAGLADRAAQLAGRLVATRSDDTFELRLELEASVG